eukprot:CAMPEP_0113888678 /NCGR_PEP_ID=MMETSP0780_2-20120614/13007_1 /TAXON_ID=652834 /ORGANISM="Palpitomonas bilix" /LENGTH=297 /DNA_ID=CAMNT_0000877557 /DNA_START=14 /DNA_END=907 /DNA_ORIENTATION=- /assembly_acc=CAM_ASM_000599
MPPKKGKKGKGKKKKAAKESAAILFWKEKTGLSKDDLMQVMKHFEAIAKDDKIDREGFQSGLKILGYEKASADRLFALADSTKDGIIDFREFMLFLSSLRSSDPEQQIELAFHICDKERKGKLSRADVRRVLEDALEGDEEGDEEMSKQKVDAFLHEQFDVLDENKDNQISMEEFKKAVKADPKLLALFGAGLVDESVVLSKRWTLLRELFQLIDRDGNGTADKKELLRFLQTVYASKSEEEIEAEVSAFLAEGRAAEGLSLADWIAYFDKTEGAEGDGEFEAKLDSWISSVVAEHV